MRTIRFGRLAALAVLPFPVSAAWAQAPRGPYYQRTTTPGFVAPRGTERVAEPPPAIAPGGWDRLQPYTATSASAAPLGNAYSSRPRVAPPRMLPPTPSARNYYPTARFGQSPNRNVQSGQDRCTPSRGGMIFGLR